MVTLFHVDYENHPKLGRDLRSPMTGEMSALILKDGTRTSAERKQIKLLEDAEAMRLSKALFEQGGYVRVAEIEGDMNQAYTATQNGVLSDSWSQEPPEGVKTFEPSFHLHDGKRYGRRSTDVGDLMQQDGRYFRVASIGFTEITF